MDQSEVNQLTQPDRITILISGGNEGEHKQSRCDTRCDVTLVMDQADDVLLQAKAGRLAKAFMGRYERVCVTSPDMNSTFACFHKIAGIVLAAGGSSRFKGPKQLLSWGDETFISQVVKTAMLAGLDPIYVVVGAFQEDVISALKGLPVRIVENIDWQQGQSTSIRAAMEALEQGIHGAMFLLADQPQITPRLIRALMENVYLSGKSIVAPMVNGKRSNPVYFAEIAFNELKTLQGDQGGRALFSKYSPQYVDWLDDRMAMDVDTSEDLAKLRSLFE